MTNKSKVDDKKYPKYFEDFMELTDLHKTNGVSTGQITDTLTFFTKLESAIRAELQDVARRAVQLAVSPISDPAIQGRRYSESEILEKLNLSDKEGGE